LIDQGKLMIFFSNFKIRLI